MKVAGETVLHCISTSLLKECFLDKRCKLHFHFLTSKLNWIWYTIMCTVFLSLHVSVRFLTLISYSCGAVGLVFVCGNGISLSVCYDGTYFLYRMLLPPLPPRNDLKLFTLSSVIERYGQLGSNPASYAGSPGFKFRSQDRLTYVCGFHGFTYALQTNFRTAFQSRPRPFFFTSFQILY